MEENKFDDLDEEKIASAEETSELTGDDEEVMTGEDDLSAEDEDRAEETSESGETQAAARGNRIAAEVYSWFDTLFFPLVIIMAVFTFFVRMSRVDGTSMLPTLEDGQQLLISNFMYEPSYNDIVVVWAEKLPNELTDERGKAIVKRVIGLPGDKISIDYNAGTVSRNGNVLELSEKEIDTKDKDGKAVKRNVWYEDGHIINEKTFTEEGLGGEFTVPEGYLFVMGDNRNGSADSRHYMIGYIDKRDMIGKAYLRIWPLNEISWLYG